MRLDELDTFRIEVSTDTRHRHLDNVATALRHQRPPRSFRKLSLILAAALFLIPLGAWASESSVPGDLLHPIKRFLEPAWAVLDSDVRARHRVEELEVLIEQQGPRSLIDQQLIDAADAVGDDPVLLERLEEAKEDLAREPVSDEMSPTTTTTTTTVATTTTVRPAGLEPTRPPTTTTTVATRESTRP
ncbi:MAG: hypothetical protein ACXW15_09820 [Acidimicrobiia bacterium]